MNRRYDQLFGDIVTILRRDYAGAALLDERRFDPRYYNQAVGQAWHDDRLDELLFLRYINQMLACTGDRHLRLALRLEGYTPWSPGFYTRRYGDSLCVTAVTNETRLAPGDRLTALNGGSPAKHRALFQKNFLYADTPEREDWNGALKMTDTVDVLYADGGTERLTLARYPLAPPMIERACRSMADGVLYLRPGAFDGGAAAFIAAHTAAIQNASGLIVDLRNAYGEDEDDMLALLPFVCRADTPLSALVDSSYYVNYTRFNCMLLAAPLVNVPGMEETVAELARLSDSGMTLEDDGDDTVIPGAAPARVVVLTDTWTRGAAERAALAASNAGARIIGRPSLGTIDFRGDVSYELDDRFVLTWPTVISAAAWEGEGVIGRGVPVRDHIPWTPGELRSDTPLDAALQYIRRS